MSAALDKRGHDFLDLNGRQVHAFTSEMANLGFQHLTDTLIAMFKSGAWRTFQDGLGVYEFLPGEFDYFLTQQGVTRDDVMQGVRDIDTKALLEAAMDERRTGKEGYRRRLGDVRAANPRRPGRAIMPFGYTKAEAKILNKEGESARRRELPALGTAVRRWRNSGGTTTSPSSGKPSNLEKARRLGVRLNDDNLTDLISALNQEKQQRRRKRNTAQRQKRREHSR